jgi:hypothetical protein
MITKTIKLHVDRMQLPPAFVVAVAVFVVAGGISAVGRYTPAGAVAQPTPALIVFATAQPALPSPEPAALVSVAQPQRYVVAFDQPAGNPMGAIPAPAPEAITARYGDAWLMTEWNGAPAWIRAAELGMQIADLAPPEVVYVAAPPTYSPPAEPVYQAADYSPPPAPPDAFVEALIGDDPQALACNGSPLCGGLTNEQARQAVEQRQR